MAIYSDDGGDGAIPGAAARAQRLRGVLDLCVLAVLQEQATYGYEIARILARSGLGDVKGGTLYPLLARLEKQGLLQAIWEDGAGGPRRKRYAVTPQGARYLEDHGSAWLRLATDVQGLLSPHLPSPSDPAATRATT